MRLKVLPYKMGSAGAKALARELSVIHGRKIFRVRDTYVPKRPTTIINWGHSHGVQLQRVHRMARYINHPEVVQIMADKLRFFRAAKACNVNTPMWTTDPQVAAGWFAEGVPNDAVYCRRILNGHGGVGIVVAKTPQELVPAPLYTRRWKNSSEYRVLCVQGHVVAVYQKRHRAENFDGLIRNADRGWYFVKMEAWHPSITEVAAQAMQNFRLDIGGVDVLYSQKRGEATVLEINTAPGLGPNSAKAVAQALNNIL